MGTRRGRDGGNGPVAPKNSVGAPTPQQKTITERRQTEKSGGDIFRRNPSPPWLNPVKTSLGKATLRLQQNLWF